MEAREGARDAELKKDLDATLHARRELGEEYESVLADSFLEKVEERLDSVVERRVRRQLAEQQMVLARDARDGGRSPVDSWGERFGFALISLILAIPLSAIAVANAGLAGLLAAWAGVVGVNALASGDRAPWSARNRAARRGDGRGGRDSDWED
ncbi:hypothetical protein [Streptomyces beihaiensis]|uniref:Integral membrane protein n=1 Tax=Streptomyces beihaiensis TaxID=2984495 RepID=A0ABT3U2A6_9ACTN|nr:hypothetical protein [Streptomyces beihaiensis]MCX3063414.1 hypothetical protein [Streptomyces beihaiensis]